MKIRQVAVALLLAGCAQDAPLCLFSCTVIVRSGSAGDDAMVDVDEVHRAREWLMRYEKGQQKKGQP